MTTAATETPPPAPAATEAHPEAGAAPTAGTAPAAAPAAAAPPCTAAPTAPPRFPRIAAGLGALALLILILTLLGSGQKANPPITVMGWAIIAWIGIGLVDRFFYRETVTLVKRAEIKPQLEADILHNIRWIQLLLALSAGAFGVFLGSAF